MKSNKNFEFNKSNRDEINYFIKRNNQYIIIVFINTLKPILHMLK